MHQKSPKGNDTYVLYFLVFKQYLFEIEIQDSILFVFYVATNGSPLKTVQSNVDR